MKLTIIIKRVQLWLESNYMQIIILATTAVVFHLINCLENPQLQWFSLDTIIDSFFFWITTVLTIGADNRYPTATLTKLLFLLALIGTYGVAGTYLQNIFRDQKKRFSDTSLQVSISFIHQGKLIIEKLLTDDIATVLRSDASTTKIIKAAINRTKVTAQDEPFLHFKPHDRETVHSLLRPVVTSLLNRNMIEITDQKAQLEECTFWATLTWEKYWLKRNLLARLIIVPEWSLDKKLLQDTQIATEKSHQDLRIITMLKMAEDSSKPNPESCFAIKVLKLKNQQ